MKFLRTCFWMQIGVVSAQLFFLTHAQSASDAGPVTYCVDPSWMPYEALHNDKHVGIAADYMQLVSELSGIKFQLVTTKSWSETITAVKAGHCEMISMISRSPARDDFLDFSVPYFEAVNVFVTRQDFPYIPSYKSIGRQIVGVVKDYWQIEYIGKYYPWIDVRPVLNETQGLLQLAAGEIDIFIGSELAVSALISNFSSGDLKVAGMAAPHDKLSFGVRKGRPELVARLSAAVEAIPQEKHSEFYQRWNKTRVVEKVDYRLIIASAALFLLIVSIVLLRNWVMSRYNRALKSKNDMLESLREELLEKNKTLEFLSNHDQLTSLHNRHYMITRCDEEIQRMQRFTQPACLVLFDIDHFKAINDTYGHSCGDQVLQELTELVSDKIREIDVLSRWGGEEFLILCPQISLTNANVLSERLGQAVDRHSFAQIGKLTCSFGVAEYKQRETFVQWFDRADNALYQAKEMGRNRVVSAG